MQRKKMQKKKHLHRWRSYWESNPDLRNFRNSSFLKIQRANHYTIQPIKLIGWRTWGLGSFMKGFVLKGPLWVRWVGWGTANGLSEPNTIRKLKSNMWFLRNRLDVNDYYCSKVVGSESLFVGCVSSSGQSGFQYLAELANFTRFEKLLQS